MCGQPGNFNLGTAKNHSEVKRCELPRIFVNLIGLKVMEMHLRSHIFH